MTGNIVQMGSASIAAAGTPAAKTLALTWANIGNFLTLTGITIQTAQQAPTIYNELIAELDENIASLRANGVGIPPAFASSNAGTAFGSFETAFFNAASWLRSTLVDSSNGGANFNTNSTTTFNNLQASTNALQNFCTVSGATAQNITTTLTNDGFSITGENNSSNTSGYFNYNLNGDVRGVAVANTDISNNGRSGYTILSHGDISTDQGRANVFASLSQQLKDDGINTENTITKATFIDAKNHSTTNNTIYGGDANQLVQNLGGSSTNGVTLATAGVNGDTVISLISNTATTVVNGITYAVSEVADSVATASTAVATFISTQVQDGITWLTKSDSAIQLDLANWLAGNLGNLINGQMSLDAAFISLAKYVALQRGSAAISAAINSTDSATDALAGIFKDAGVTDQVLAAKYAGSVYTALSRMAIDFAFNSQGWSAEQYVKAVNDNFINDLIMFNRAA